MSDDRKMFRPRAGKDSFEIWVKRTQSSGEREWELLLGEVSDGEAALQYKGFLTGHREFSEDDVKVIKVMWSATTILEVG